MSDSAAPWTAAHQASLSFTISQSLLKLMSRESVMLSNHLILCHPLLLLPLIFPSIRVFSSESTLCFRWPNSWHFSFSIHSSNEYSGLISFRIEWFDLLAVQGTLKNLLQHHSSKALILWCSAFFMVYLSHVYMNNGKTVTWTIWTFVGKVKSLLFNRPFKKSLLNLLQYCFYSIFFFFWLQAWWDLSSLIGDQTHTPCIGRWSPNCRTAREGLRWGF